MSSINMHHLMVKKNFANFGGPAPMLFSRFSLQSGNAERCMNPLQGGFLTPCLKMRATTNPMEMVRQ